MLGVFLIGLFVVFTGTIGIIATGIIGDKVDLVTQVTSPTVEAIDDLTIILVQNSKVIHAYTTEYNGDDRNNLRRAFDDQNDAFDEVEREVRKVMEAEELITKLNTASKRYDSFKDKAEKVISNHLAEIAENDEEEKNRYFEVKGALLKQLDDDADDAIAILQEIAVEVSELNEDANRESISAVKNTKAIILFITLLGLGLAIAIGFFFTKLIVRPVNELAEAAAKVSEGNFEVKVKGTKSDDEINHLTQVFNKMVISLRNMIEESPRLKRFMQLMPSSEKTSSKEEEYNLNEGTSYLLQEADSKKAFTIFHDKVTHNYQGLCISRTNPETIKKRYNFQKTPVLWLSDAKESNVFSSSDLLIIGKLITDFLVKSQKPIILLDRVDYLIAKHGFDEVLRFIIKINDKIMVTKAILLVPVDSSLMKSKDLSFLRKEMQELQSTTSSVDLPQELIRILEFIDSRKNMGEEVTFKDIGQRFSITAPTTQKRLQDLFNRGFIKVVKQGRNKVVELTEKGKDYLSGKNF